MRCSLSAVLRHRNGSTTEGSHATETKMNKSSYGFPIPTVTTFEAYALLN
jgi:hypothetical protein